METTLKEMSISALMKSDLVKFRGKDLRALQVCNQLTYQSGLSVSTTFIPISLQTFLTRKKMAQLGYIQLFEVLKWKIYIVHSYVEKNFTKTFKIKNARVF